MSIYVKNGTPVGKPSLCESCSRAFIARGYSETELVVVCNAPWRGMRMIFPVRACTAFVEKNKPTIVEMEEIALVLDRVALKRDAGFVRVSENENNNDAKQIELILNSNE
jgi:hypothetical protein